MSKISFANESVILGELNGKAHRYSYDTLIVENQVIDSGSNVQLEAGRSIKFGLGTSIKHGVSLSAKIKKGLTRWSYNSKDFSDLATIDDQSQLFEYPLQYKAVTWKGYFYPPSSGNYMFSTLPSLTSELALDGQIALIQNSRFSSVSELNIPVELIRGVGVSISFSISIDEDTVLTDLENLNLSYSIDGQEVHNLRPEDTAPNPPHQWLGPGLWSDASQWSFGVVPSAHHTVLFSGSATGGCELDTWAEVESLVVSSNVTATLNLSQLPLKIRGDLHLKGTAVVEGSSMVLTGTGHQNFVAPQINFESVTIENSMGQVHVFGGLTAETLRIVPGAHVYMEAFQDIDLCKAFWQGTEAHPIRLESTEPDSAWKLKLLTRDSLFEHLILADSDARSGEEAIADPSSIDLGGNQNWSFSGHPTGTPVITMLTPKPSEIVALGEFTISGTFDHFLPVPEKTTLSIDGVVMEDFKPTMSSFLWFSQQALEAGSHQLEIYAENRYGQSLSLSRTVFVSTDAPTAPVFRPPFITNDPKPTWSWMGDGETGTGIFRVRLDHPNTLHAQEQNRWSFTAATNLSDGLHKLYVQEKNTDGNWSMASVGEMVVDTQGPPAPKMTGPSYTRDPTLSWTWTGAVSGEGVFRYALNQPSLENSGTITQGLSFSSPSNLPDGHHTLFVQERDLAGNWSSAGTHTIILDRVPPVITNVSVSLEVSPAQPTWTWTSVDAVEYRYGMDHENQESMISLTEPQLFWNSVLSEGEHTLFLQAKDEAGNWSASFVHTVNIDHNSPEPPINLSPSYSNSKRPTWSWKGGGRGNGWFRFAYSTGQLATAEPTRVTSYTAEKDFKVISHIFYTNNPTGTILMSYFGRDGFLSNLSSIGFISTLDNDTPLSYTISLKLMIG